MGQHLNIDGSSVMEYLKEKNHETCISQVIWTLCSLLAGLSQAEWQEAATISNMFMLLKVKNKKTNRQIENPAIVMCTERQPWTSVASKCLQMQFSYPGGQGHIVQHLMAGLSEFMASPCD